MELTSRGVTFALFFCLQLTTATQGKLVFRNPLHDARIYEGAPAGIHVATVQAYEAQSARKSVMYSLLDVREHEYFTIDSTSGNISTTKAIEKKVGDTYEIIAVAISQGETKLRQLQVTVTEYNEYPPVFEHEVYRGELHVKAKVGTAVLRVRATDADTLPYNAEVYYKLDPEDPKGRFSLDPLNGVLSLAKSLDSMPLQSVVEFGVVVVDGGSPRRSDSARIEVLVKTISEPREVRYANATGTKVHICWNRPKHGHVLGYLIKYREVENPHGSPSFHNITSNSSSHCTTLVDLKAWTDYEFRVYGWNYHETGQGSTVGRFGTRPDYCQMNVCKHGECHVLNEEPGYHCDCVLGYYGNVCDKFNPCSLSPCENFGICRNISSNKYRCECLSGFSGLNCSEFNPCAIRPSPCLNGGRCESTASHKYQCYCIKGYYGKTCDFFDPCSVDPCQNGGRCQNVSQSDYLCKCVPGFAGKQCEIDVDECASSPCKHGGICLDAVNNFHCRCAPGYRGKRCHLIEHCIAQTVQTDKGLFRWNSTAHGRAYLIECPFGSIFPDREGAVGYAKRRCYLLSNGSVAWGRMDLTNCREEGFKTAEDLTGELRMLTQDPKHLNIARLQEAAKQIENIIEYALYDKKIANNMLSIISNMLAIDEFILETGDRNGTTSNRLTDLVDKFVSEVKLEKGESLSLSTENLVVKAHSWDPDSSEFGEEDGLLFSVRYRQQRQRRDQGRSGKHRTIPHHTRWSEELDDDTEIIDDDTELLVPLEALLMAQNQTYEEVRVKFVAYRNDKFFRIKYPNNAEECWKNNYRGPECADGNAYIRFPGRRVLQASIANATVTNLSDPLLYIMPSPILHRVYCAYWKENERIWSTEGLLTNQTGNMTTCFSNHMTSFSLLLDPTPHEGISPDHYFALSMISYIGCGLSMLGLALTILTYSMFRCLNHDHPGQILLHLCSSMLLMNAAFVAGSQKGHALYGVDVCVSVAVMVHYFLLTTLAWMGVEAANMYQLLIHVFASSESRFMLKRAILAWGIPLVIVGVTVLIDWGVYQSQNEYCMLTAANPYVYYISYLGPSCLILLVNLTVFVMVTRVLFTPRNISKPAAAMQTKEKIIVTAAQVRGAFSVMVLLGVSWVFGAFAVGEARLIFQYLFCIANSLQGFLIFLVRCLQYPEARSAWCQLLKTGTFKKYRGMAPPGSWSGNSNSSHNKQNGHSTTTRLGSTDANAVAFNANFWNKGASKEDERQYEDQQSENGQDFAARSAQLLTFCSSLKQEPKEEKHGKRLSFEKSVSKSFSGSSDGKHSTHSAGCVPASEQKPVADTARNESEVPKTTMLRQDAVLPNESEVLAIPAEPKSRSSYGSSIGYIDEEAELKEKAQALALEKKLFAQKASSLAGHPKQNSPPDKQNSWPRTLSSFLGGKDVLKSSLSETGHHSTMPKRIFSPPVKSPLAECSERHSSQIIPLQVRPSTPLLHPPAYTPPRNLSSEKEYKDVPVLKESAIPDVYSHREIVSPRGSLSETASLPDRSWSSVPPSDNHQKSLPSYGQHIAMHPESLRRTTLDGGTDPGLVPGPLPHTIMTHPTDNHPIPQIGEFPGEFGVLADEDTFRIWERQGLVSPSKAMFLDSAASRL